MTILDLESRSNIVLLNPRLPEDHQHSLRSLASSFSQVSGHVWIATSGSTGLPKLVALSKAAVVASAEAVNRHLNASREDRWCLALPLFHVGGLGVVARAQRTQSKLFELGGWSPLGFVSLCTEERITLTSLVPTQLYDLISLGLECPPCLRALIVGGGALSERLLEKARSLKWPILPSFGMTECASQIATAEFSSQMRGSPRLRVLDHLRVTSDPSGRLCIEGKSLFTGYATFDRKKPIFVDPKVAGVFLSEDLGEVSSEGSHQYISPKGRISEFVKVRGELVSMTRLNSLAEEHLPYFRGVSDACIVARPHERTENQIVLVGVGTPHELLALSEKLATRLLPYERPESVFVVDEIPRTDLRKVRLTEVLDLLKTGRAKRV